MHVVFAGLSLLLLATEQVARFCAIHHYCLTGQLLWCWVTMALLLPGYLAQVLSFLWFQADGHKPGCSLMLIHILQLGIWKRYWNALWLALKEGGSSFIREVCMQQGDLAVLRLLEALLQTLPNLLLQAYACVVMEAKGIVPGLSAGISLLSLSWALVSYSRFVCLIKPGHLSMPGAALLCQLLWRTGMIGTRVMSLVIFARVYHFWVLVPAGAHWLVMSYWIVAQQTDIFRNPWHWKLFNFLTGAIYTFCYISFKDGSSRYRMAVFYILMLSENALLLLMSMDFLQENLWSSLWIIGAVMSGFIVGSAALVTYYSLLHPKSSEIWQNFLKRPCTVVSENRKGTDGSIFQSMNQTIRSTVVSGLQNIEVSSEESSMQQLGIPNISSLVDLGGPGSGKDSWGNHHHWLLIKLALKTGDISKISAAYGEVDLESLYPVVGVKHKQSISKLDPRRKLIFSPKGRFPVSPKSRVMKQRFLEEENTADNLSRNVKSSYATLSSRKHVTVDSIPEECSSITNPIQHIPSVGTDLKSIHECCLSKQRGIPAISHEGHSKGEAEQQVQMCTSLSVYVTASIEKDASPDTKDKTAAAGVDGRAGTAGDNQLGEAGGFLLPADNASPILAVSTKGCLQSSPVCCFPTHYSAPASPKCSDQEGMLRVQCSSSNTNLYGIWVAVFKRNQSSAEEPWLTSTPKTDTTGQG
ncbi:XK-related protein 5 isoform X2 [Hemicordylus capensis]|uniref:XK-related protein 5 isoform X2 n=1 Tax=Hemicordylus capensis TaxID=884348 RepID=UPI0023045E40|nr:XK-related protein 5 isoform X2 [Hemicordylus capensis]